MPDTKILIDVWLRELVLLDTDAVDCIEHGFSTLADGNHASQPQCAVKGELRCAIETGVVSRGQGIPELGAITSGTGVQNTAIVTFARRREEPAGVGSIFSS